MIRVLIADDHAILRRGLREILTHELEGVLCGEAENAQQVLAQVQSQNWDLLILDITMPGRSGVDVLGDLKRIRPRLPVLVLSVHTEDQYRKRVLKARARGYMNKESAPEGLIRAKHKVLGGGRYVSPALAERLALELGAKAESASHEILSDREFEVLRMIGLGKTISQIAEELRSRKQGKERQMTASDVLDCFEALASTGGDTGFLAELAGIFDAACPTLLERIQHALAEGDIAAAVRAAHLLEVAAQNVTAKRVAGAALDVETLARQKLLERAQEAYRELVLEIERLKPLLSDLEREALGSDG